MAKKLSPFMQERIQTVKTNRTRLGVSFEQIADDLDMNEVNIYATLRGRYSEDTADKTLSTIETYLKGALGVRYVQPYFGDLPK